MPFDSKGMNIEVPKSIPVDAELAQRLEVTAKEAQERIAYHRSELLMWQRVQRAASEALAVLSADETEPNDSEQIEQAAPHWAPSSGGY